MTDSIGRYRVVRQLGRGGMGEVYLAEDSTLQRNVAVKVLSNVDPRSKSRFLREAIAASKLSHPNVAVVYETGETDGVPFIAMQYVEGETVRDRLARGLMPVDEVIRIAREVADALDEAHRHGIIHRDIKPANVMIDTRGRAKVLDFGIAKVLEPDRDASPDDPTAAADTVAGTFVGTLQYVSPEQAGGEAVDQRSDLFSLGVLMYEMIGGQNPFAAATFLETVRRIREMTPPPVERGDCPAALSQIVSRCLEKDREQRYQSARDVVLDLERIGRAPVRARGGAMAIAAAAIALLVVAGTWIAFRRHNPASAPVTVKIDSVAVLPFVNLSPNRENEYIGDGISEEVINALAQLSGLKVVSRTSSFALKGKALTYGRSARRSASTRSWTAACSGRGAACASSRS